jgi:hypothetical protein
MLRVFHFTVISFKLPSVYIYFMLLVYTDLLLVKSELKTLVLKWRCIVTYRIQRAELGYLLRSLDLDSGQRLHDPSHTSIRSLSLRHSEIEFDDLLRGNASFGAYLENFGFRAVPSPTDRGPGPGNPYFNGGYLTRRHGSKDGGTIDAIQIESARPPREPGTRERYAYSVAQAIAQYICRYYVTSQRELIGEQPETVAADCRQIASGQFRIRPMNYVALAGLVAVSHCVMQLVTFNCKL